MRKVTNINDEAIAPYKTLKKLNNDYVQNKNYFVAEGEKVVLRLLKSAIRINSIFSTLEFLNKHLELIESKVPTNAIYVAEKALMSEIVGYKLHDGVMALAVEPDEADFANFDDRIIAMNAIVDSENVGAIVRNAAAFDMTSVLIDSESSSPYLRRAVRVSLGNIFKCKHHISKDFVLDLQYLRDEYGYSIIAAEISDNSISLKDFDFPSKCVIVFGNEGRGISADVLNICDSIVKIPINPESDSINVAASSAVFFYELNK